MSQHDTTSMLLRRLKLENRLLGPGRFPKVYCASKASTPERPAMWRELRALGLPVTSSWIDEAGQGETKDFSDLWHRISLEVAHSSACLVYVEKEDFPMKGALVEAGMALGTGRPVFIAVPGVLIQYLDKSPLGSWASHPLVHIRADLGTALDALFTWWNNASTLGEGRSRV